jgi:hypothetical protein
MSTDTKTDFNNDGISDILMISDTGKITARLIDENGDRSTLFLGKVSAEWRIAGTGDFNGDSLCDILLEKEGGGIVTWLFDSDGNRSSDYLGNINAANSFADDVTVLSTGDYDGDGITDLLLRAPGSEQAGLWLLNGTGGRQIPPPSTPGDSIIRTSGDFNGDGTDDFQDRYDVSGIYTGEFSGPDLLPQFTLIGQRGNSWTEQVAGDMNGDGTDDLVMLRDTGRVDLWLMEENLQKNVEFIGKIKDGWRIEGTGDYNGDGRDDILIRKDNGKLIAWGLDENGDRVVQKLGRVADTTVIPGKLDDPRVPDDAAGFGVEATLVDDFLF